jgi:rod shape-determining protein MreB
VYIIEEPMAAAIGIRLPIMEPVGSMIIDIGGGTTDIAVISLSGVVRAKSLKLAGDKMNEDIIHYLRNEFKLLVGEKTAEEVKIILGSYQGEGPIETKVRGRDLISGLPREIMIHDRDLYHAIEESLKVIVDTVREVLETTPPEIVADIMSRGMYLAGGGALIRGLDKTLADQFKIPVFVADDPLSAVARGCGIVLEDVEKYREVLISNHDTLPLR